MERFRCRVSDVTGRVDVVVRTGPSEEIVARELAAEGLFVLSVSKGEQRAKAGRARLKASLLRDFTDSLSALLSAGLTLSDSLDVQQSVFESGAGAQLISFLRSRVQRGNSFSAALDDLGASFPPVYTGLVRIGEQVGTLAAVISRLSSYLEKQKQIRDKFLGSLTYPAIVLFVAVAGVVVIGTVVLPQIQSMFRELGNAMPEALGATRLLQAFALAAGAGLASVLAGAVVAAIAGRGEGGVAVDRLVLRIPIVGEAMRRQEVLNFVFAMETLTESGVPIETAIRQAGEVFHNAALRDSAAGTAGRVVAGAPLSVAFAGADLLPRRLSIWARIGERTGNAGAIFGQLRGYYEAEVNRWIDRFMTLVEPALIVVVGAIMLIMVLTVVVPLFSVFGSIL